MLSYLITFIFFFEFGAVEDSSSFLGVIIVVHVLLRKFVGSRGFALNSLLRKALFTVSLFIGRAPLPLIGKEFRFTCHTLSNQRMQHI